MASKLLTALLTPDRNNHVVSASSLSNDSLITNFNLTSTNNTYNDTISLSQQHGEYISQTSYVSDYGESLSPVVNDLSGEESVVRSVYNTSVSVFRDVLRASNTPLTAPELGLVTVSREDFGQLGAGRLEGSSGHTAELAWLIPAVIGVILLLVFIALLMFFGIRTLELRLMGCCFRTFGCCDRGGGRGERRPLNQEMAYYDAGNADL
ncbi:uncharacterized protein LOC106012912 [Aplysia californica]|uniref:Uncharacterized protein LOC106012912 n=1 Tax=Aplysia californica TaxID=6500 RepID=A0ABM1A857_APLCA|nr:uncharacterized protein LOC106012912 [Aplysia californica]